MFGNRVITNAAFHSAHVPFRFQGRFFGSPWPWWWGGIVIGWVGPVFWPYFFFDFCDYVFWPYAYDDFWPYAYDDIYYGIYGPYAYSGPPARIASVDTGAPSSPRQLAQPNEGTARQRTQTKQAKEAEPRAAEVCSNNASELAQWPIERISQVVQPTDAQRAALDELKAESAKAIDLLKGACPNAPSTIALIFPKAMSRGRYFIPQSGAMMRSLASTKGRARRIRWATVTGVSTAGSERSSTPRMIFLPRSRSKTEQSRDD